MSRFSHKIEKNGKEYEVAYGYDRPLSEYFIQVFDPSIEDEDNQLIVWEGSRMTNKSNGEMYRLFEKWGVKEEHLECLAMDLSF